MQPRLAEFLGGVRGQLGAAGQLGRNREDDSAIRVADVPLGALGVARAGRLLERVLACYGAVFRFAALRTPTTVGNVVEDRPVEGCAVCACLSAGDDLFEGHGITSVSQAKTSTHNNDVSNVGGNFPTLFPKRAVLQTLFT